MEIVQMVRKANPKVSTLAIGDGANDVNMISAAHVGIGIKYFVNANLFNNLHQNQNTIYKKEKKKFMHTYIYLYSYLFRYLLI